MRLYKSRIFKLDINGMVVGIDHVVVWGGVPSLDVGGIVTSM